MRFSGFAARFLGIGEGASRESVPRGGGNIPHLLSLGEAPSDCTATEGFVRWGTTSQSGLLPDSACRLCSHPAHIPQDVVTTSYHFWYHEPYREVEGLHVR